MTNNFDRNATFFDLRGKAKWLKAIREGATRGKCGKCVRKLLMLLHNETVVAIIEELINDTFRYRGLFVGLLVKCQPVGIAVVAEFEDI